MGLQCSICDFNKGPQLEVGGGLKPKIELQIANDFSDFTNDKITVEATASAYLSAKFQLLKFYQYELSAEPKLEIAKWTLYRFERTWKKPDVPTDGLVAYYPFKWNANDESGNGNHGTVHGATLTIDRKGNPSNAYYFDGNSYIKVDNSEILASLTDNYSISLWAKSISNHYAMLCKSLVNGYDIQFRMWIDDNNLFSIISNKKDIIYTLSMQNAQWNHVVVVFNNGECKVFINNILQDNIIQLKASDFPNNFNTDLFIGLDGHGYSEFHVGEIDDIRIYNRALTNNEIQSLYNE
jgi:hypothetical protein